MAVDGRQGKEILREKREERGSRKGKGKRKGKERERKKMRQEKGKVGRGKKKKMEAKGNGRRSSLFSEQIHTSELSCQEGRLLLLVLVDISGHFLYTLQSVLYTAD